MLKHPHELRRERLLATIGRYALIAVLTAAALLMLLTVSEAVMAPAHRPV